MSNSERSRNRRARIALNPERRAAENDAANARRRQRYAARRVELSQQPHLSSSPTMDGNCECQQQHSPVRTKRGGPELIKVAGGAPFFRIVPDAPLGPWPLPIHPGCACTARSDPGAAIYIMEESHAQRLKPLQVNIPCMEGCRSKHTVVLLPDSDEVWAVVRSHYESLLVHHVELHAS